MMITPQARRRITDAVQALDTQARSRWGTWAERAAPNQVRTDVPYEIAVIAHEALTAAAYGIERLLSSETLDEDREADLLNDLGFVQAIDASLRKEGVGK